MIFSITSSLFEPFLNRRPHKRTSLFQAASPFFALRLLAVWTKTEEQLKFCISGIAPEKILNSEAKRAQDADRFASMTANLLTSSGMPALQP
jgi:hypothetical protein